MEGRGWRVSTTSGVSNPGFNCRFGEGNSKFRGNVRQMAAFTGLQNRREAHKAIL